jgi:Domain of unknown function (DUF4232)
MRFRKSVTVSVCVFGAGLLAAGCSPGSSSSSSSSAAGSATTPAATASAAASAAASVPAASGTQAAGGSATCQAGALNFALGAKTGAAGQQMTQVVDMTNKGSSACTMQGFPGVDLIGVANGQQNFSWSLERSSTSYAPVTLQPGGSAHFNLIYLPTAAGGNGGISVFKMELTPPNSFTQAEVTWDQDVLLQDGATRPGTYIGPVTAGA